MAENNSPVSNPMLVQAIKDMKVTNAVNEKIYFFREFIKARLLLPVQIQPEPVNNVVAEDAEISYYSMKTSKGDILLACFTDFDELRKWNNTYASRVVVFDFEHIKTLIEKTGDMYDGVVIDPLGENVYIRRQAILNIETQTRPDLVVKPEKVVTQNNMGLVPAEALPDGLLDALCAHMSGQANINRAFAMQTVRSGDSTPTIVIVVDFKGSNMKYTFDGIAEAAKPFIPQGRAMGMMPAFDKTAAQAIAGIEPFYKK